MPRYFIDTDNGDLEILDEEGLDLPDLKAARDAAHLSLPDMARDKIPDGERRNFRASVRDQDGRILYVVTLTLAGEWIADK